MKIKIISIINICFGILIFSLPALVAAQGGIIDNKQPVDYYTYEMFWQTLVKVVNFILELAVLFVVIIIVWAGIVYLTSASNPGKIAQANKMLQAAVIGFFIASAAWLLVRVVTNTIGVDKSLVPNGF